MSGDPPPSSSRPLRSNTDRTEERAGPPPPRALEYRQRRPSIEIVVLANPTPGGEPIFEFPANWDYNEDLTEGQKYDIYRRVTIVLEKPISR